MSTPDQAGHFASLRRSEPQSMDGGAGIVGSLGSHARELTTRAHEIVSLAALRLCSGATEGKATPTERSMRSVPLVPIVVHWFGFFLGGITGGLTIGHGSPIVGAQGGNGAAAALAVSWVAIGNFGDRFGGAWTSERVSPHRTTVAFQALALVAIAVARFCLRQVRRIGRWSDLRLCKCRLGLCRLVGALCRRRTL